MIPASRFFLNGFLAGFFTILPLFFAIMGLEALFLTGVNVGFMPAGYYLGGQIAGLPYRWILVPLAMVIGFYIVPLSIKKPSCSQSLAGSWKKAASMVLSSRSR